MSNAYLFFFFVFLSALFQVHHLFSQTPLATLFDEERGKENQGGSYIAITHDKDSSISSP